MRYLSICSGIEAASVAWHPLGFEPVGFSEIEPFPCSVLSHRFPNVRNYGDMTKHETWNIAPGSVDLVAGGTPCQAFSVAGLRRGLEDARGNLTLVFLGILERVRPRWVVWENVPGVLSDKTGAFGAFLGGLGQLGYGFAYRVLDAQYFGVAQRRRRVFVVGHLGDWRRAAAVLFERESLRGDSAPRRRKGERTAPTIAARTRGGGGLGTDAECDVALIPSTCGTLSDGAHMGGCSTARTHTPGASFPPDVSPALKARDGKGPSSDVTGDGAPLIPMQVGGFFDEAISFPWQLGGTMQMTCAAEQSGTLVKNQTQAVAFKPSHYTRNKDGAPSQVTPPLSADADKGDQDTVVAFERRMVRTSGGQPSEELQPTLRDDANSGDGAPCVAGGMQVRRLTPRECERLQGFPDDWTLVPHKGKPACDGPRYKAIGNSMAVPVMQWIGARIQLVERIQTEAT